ncbi:unnamed protein product [Phytophthora fragariaefolia]|uniref:Unnamed protein product n=1 Tax=Phytophthora fragariaefolia TaxID=1490495 RepID=A0A9W6WUX8_9STRA|nr:unnamed protein product [Phytophthora fragariaefolia]
MPPKSVERLKKELAAQKARAEALKYLQSTGSGPSQRELAQQQQLRQKQTSNATSAVAQRRVLGSQPREPSAADQFDPRVRDNTLHAVALRRAQDLQKTQQIDHETESCRLEAHTTQHSALPSGWQEVVDPASGDSILKRCGKPTSEHAKADTTKARKVDTIPAQPSGSESFGRPSNAVPTKRPAIASQNSGSLANKRRKRDADAIDPMDPTGTGGKWSDGLEQG